MRAAYDFADLGSFLDLYYAACDVLVTREDFRDLTLAYLRRVARDNVRHVEPFFDPQTHTARGIAFDTVISGILDGLEIGEREFGITSGLILSFLRDLTEQSRRGNAFGRDAVAFSSVVAVGLDSAELGDPAEKFAGVFARARGLPGSARGGPRRRGGRARAGAAHARRSRRLAHRPRCALRPGPRPRRRLVREGIPLTVCPLQHQAARVRHDGRFDPGTAAAGRSCASPINSDDPAYFGGYLAENFRCAAAAFWS